MLTYTLDREAGPLYEALYRGIRGDILEGRLMPGEKLPSKRALADHLKISKVTVETAYAQLVAEGYIRSQEKVGYFVEAVEQGQAPAYRRALELPEAPRPVWEADFTANNLPAEAFPFSVWAKLQREVLLDYGAELLGPVPPGGAYVLRQAIADYLYGFRSMTVSPDQILVGAGTDFLYNLLIQLLGRDKCYGVEDPGYGKIRQVYEAAGVPCLPVPLDGDGIRIDRLGEAQVLHLSPSHHFPTGIVTPIGRRQALLEWAEGGEGRYLIEDDYDSEFRLAGRPIPTLQSIDRAGKVIYLNSFTKSIAPAIRISYLVLPPELMEEFRRRLGFYACTVPSFEQYTLARFLSRGYFEKVLPGSAGPAHCRLVPCQLLPSGGDPGAGRGPSFPPPGPDSPPRPGSEGAVRPGGDPNFLPVRLQPAGEPRRFPLPSGQLHRLRRKRCPGAPDPSGGGAERLDGISVSVWTLPLSLRPDVKTERLQPFRFDEEILKSFGQLRSLGAGGAENGFRIGSHGVQAVCRHNRTGRCRKILPWLAGSGCPFPDGTLRKRCPGW